MFPVHRNKDTEWVERLGVFAYPKLIAMDGYGRIIEQLGTNTPRNVTDMVNRLNKGAKYKPNPYDKLQVPPTLITKIPEEIGQDLDESDPIRRNAAWAKVLESPELSSSDFVKSFDRAPDDYTRIKMVEKMDDGDAYSLALEKILVVVNDNLRLALLNRLGETPNAQTTRVLNEMIKQSMSGKLPGNNHNNMLVAAATAAITLPDPELAESLATIIKQKTPNDSAWVKACQALKKILKTGENAIAEQALNEAEVIFKNKPRRGMKFENIR